MNRPLHVLAPVAALACASCVQSEADVTPETAPVVSAERGCFFGRRINGYSEAPDGPGGGDRFYVKTGANERWLLETYGPCPGLDWSLSIALDTRSVSSVCTGETVTVIVPRSIGGMPDRCTARVLGKVVEPRT